MLRIYVKDEIDATRKNITEVARRLGITQGALSNLLSGKRLLTDAKAKEILVKGLNFRPSEADEKIAKWRIEEYKEKGGFAAQINPNNRTINIGGIPILHLPMYGTISCGIADDTNKYVDVPATELDPKKDYYVLRANGHSMSDEIPHGAQLVIERTNEYRGATEIYAFKLGVDQFGLGRMTKSKTHWEITKSNKNYPPIPIDTEDGVEICGIVALITYKP